MKIISLKANKDYKKIYYFLKDNGFSESLISNLRKRTGALIIDGISKTMRDGISNGEELSVTFVDTKPTQLEFNDLQLDILFENDDLLVVNKPAGVPTIPSKSHFSDNLAGCVAKYMQKRNEPFVFRAIGRLDRETSGIVVLALNQYAAEKTKVEKTYYALCHGTFDKKNFAIEKPILTENEGGINIRKRQISSDGKPATTFVKVLENKGENSLIELKLVHGRTHQIRLHLSSIGHPLCGDRLYGTKDKFSRTMLHCGKAKITLPDNKKIEVNTPFPKDFE